MSISKIQIFNIALNILGVCVPIEKANYDDNRYILLNNYYELARDYVLKDFDWNFASTFKELSLASIDLNELNYSQYKYCYDYLNDCVFSRDIFSKNTFVLEKFCVHSLQNNKKVILTDAKDAVLRYTRRILNESFFTPEFSMALSYYLASLTSSAVVGSIQKGEIAYQKYIQILKHAKMINANEGAENIFNDTTYLDVRG